MVDPATHLAIHSSRLGVEIARPGAIYSASRFDWTAFITQVTLDGQHTFCVPESYDIDKSTGGSGLCSEFGIEAPIGYDDCPPGETFPKLGIGLLVRPDDGPYVFMKPYTIQQQFPVKIDQGEDCVTFTVEPLETRGYAARTIKRLTVHDNRLEVDVTLENVGQKPIRTTEYSHNFLGIDQMAMGPDYILRLAAPVQAMDVSKIYRKFLPWYLRILPKGIINPMIRDRVAQGNRALRIDGAEISLTETPTSPFYLRLEGQPKADGPQWELEYRPAGIKVRESDDFTPLHVAVWGAGHVISAEVFIDLNVQPGESVHWVRQYEFLSAG
jgi:hypothetical protein